MCHAGKWNLSYECLTSYDACEALRNMKTTDPAFWKELTMDEALDSTDQDDMDIEEADEMEFELFHDDSNLLSEVVVAHVLENESLMDITANTDGHLMSAAQAESLEDDIEPFDGEPAHEADRELQELGVGKRKHRENMLYSSSFFWHHHDNDDPNSEHYT